MRCGEHVKWWPRKGSHRPLEVEGDADGATCGHRSAIHGDDVAQCSSKCAGRFWRHNGLSVLEADAEEEAAGVGPAAQASGAAGGEGVNLELKDTGRFGLWGEEREAQVYTGEAASQRLALQLK